MPDNAESNAVLGFLVGAILVAALAFIFFALDGSNGAGKVQGDVNIKVEAPQVPSPAPSHSG